MCKPKLKKNKIFLVSTFFLHICESFYMTCWVFLAHFLAQNCQKQSLDCQRKLTKVNIQQNSIKYKMGGKLGTSEQNKTTGQNWDITPFRNNTAYNFKQILPKLGKNLHKHCSLTHTFLNLRPPTSLNTLKKSYDMWHMTCHMSHVTRYMWHMVEDEHSLKIWNWTFWTNGWPNEWMNELIINKAKAISAKLFELNLNVKLCNLVTVWLI